jgi:hypothetical protein
MKGPTETAKRLGYVTLEAVPADMVNVTETTENYRNPLTGEEGSYVMLTVEPREELTALGWTLEQGALWARTTCRHCGGDMLIKVPPYGGYKDSDRFCTFECRHEYERERNREAVRAHRERNPAPKKQPTERTCECCGETFTAKREDARYCGPTCRQRARRARA